MNEDVGCIEACAVYSDLEEGTEVIFRTIGFADATRKSIISMGNHMDLSAIWE